MFAALRVRLAGSLGVGAIFLALFVGLIAHREPTPILRLAQFQEPAWVVCFLLDYKSKTKYLSPIRQSASKSDEWRNAQREWNDLIKSRFTIGNNVEANCAITDDPSYASERREQYGKLAGTIARTLIEVNWEGEILAQSGAPVAPEAKPQEVELVASSESPRSTVEGERASQQRPKAAPVQTPLGTILMTPQKKAEYEAKLAEHQRQLAEHQRQLAEREKAIADAATKHAANKAAAEAEMARHEQQLAEHRAQIEAAARTAAQNRTALAVQGMTDKQDADVKVAFREGVVLCRKSETSDQFHCKGPLQNVTTKLDAPESNAELGNACGSSQSIRDLGMVSGYRAFGCGFGIHPTAKDYPGNTDVPAQLGIDFVPGRGVYHCPTSKLAYCRG